jgi:hypothetical protein
MNDFHVSEVDQNLAWQQIHLFSKLNASTSDITSEYEIQEQKKSNGHSNYANSDNPYCDIYP